ncbi:hypothetical protein HDU78_000647, partial [Chytriomyces hyalinus]
MNDSYHHQGPSIPPDDTALTQPPKLEEQDAPPVSMKGAGGINLLESPDQQSKQQMQLDSNGTGDDGCLVAPTAAAAAAAVEESELETGHHRRSRRHKASAKGGKFNGRDTGNNVQSISSTNEDAECSGGTAGPPISLRVKYDEPQVFSTDKVTLPIVRAASLAQETISGTNKKTQQRKTHVCNWEGCGK